MKKLFVAIPLLICTLSVQAQEENRVRELGVSFTDFNGFSLFFRHGNTDAVWRYTITNVAFNLSPSSGFSAGDRKSYSIGVALGREWRRPINDKLQWRYGPELALFSNGFNNQFEEAYTVALNYSIVARAVLGLNYSINKNVFVGIEVLPNISYTSRENWSKPNDLVDEQYSSSQEYNINIRNSTFLNLGWRF